MCYSNDIVNEGAQFVIQAENLSISYAGDLLFEDVCFTINPREKCAFVGRNGSGKTTLLRILVGQEKPDRGQLIFSKGYRLGYLDQHICFSMPTVIEEALLGLKNQEQQETYKAQKILTGLGFEEVQMQMPPGQLSGGYHLRLNLAKVLLSEPDCLLLDEPTNYLDILSIGFLISFLKQWKGELLIISHDRQFLDSISTHTLGLHRKKIRKIRGDTLTFFQQIVQEEEIYERTRLNQEKKREHLQSYIDRFGAKASKAAQAQSKQKMLDRIPALEELKKFYHLDLHFHERAFSGKKMLEAKQLRFGYAQKTIIHDLSLVVEPQDRIAIIGKNGYGKSTLLRLLVGDLIPEQGELLFSEQTAIGYFGQTHIQRLQSEKTIEEEIADANTQLNFSDVKRICGQMLFPGDIAKKRIAVLSGGEKSRVLLGRILASACNLLLLDEPTHHLDIESIEALIDALEEFQGAVIIVTHSELILKRLNLDKLILCHAGRQELFLGNYEEFLTKKGWQEEQLMIKPKDKRKPVATLPTQSLNSLKQQIQRLEKSLFDLELEQEQEQQLLTQASVNNATQTIQALVKKIAERQEKIDLLYEQLSALEKKKETLFHDGLS